MNPTLGQIIFREMLPSDVEAGLELCRASHWNQVGRDWDCFLGLNPRGCRVAVKEHRVVGTVVTLRYPDRYGRDGFSWIAMVLVDPAERRRGIGSKLMHEALKCLHDQSTIRLDATPAGLEVYRKMDFQDEYALSRMEIPAARARFSGNHSLVRPLSEEDLPQVEKVDYRHFGAVRRLLLQWLFQGAPEYAKVVLRDGEIAGFSFGRHGFKHEHIGPIVAAESESARMLLEACLGERPERSFLLDVPHHDTEWMRCIRSVGFEEQRPFLRMCRGEARRWGIPEKQFAIVGPEFG